jgi:uncharacterized protein YceK
MTTCHSILQRPQASVRVARKRAPATRFALACSTCAVATTAFALVTLASPVHAQVTETVLYNFTGGPDGSGPNGQLRLDATGPSGAVRGIYGATFDGAIDNCTGGCGALFKLTPPGHGGTAWTETTLWDFTNGVDSAYPSGSLLSQSKRISQQTPLYGTTQADGGTAGYGTVFSIVGNTLTTIYSFTGGADGGYPFDANVVADNAGAIYATTTVGGNDIQGVGCGTVIKLTPPAPGQTAWTETTIWTFDNVIFDNGCAPDGLVFGKDGALYGTTQYGDFAGGYNGSVFRLAPPANGGTHWTEQNLYYFTSAQSGTGPLAKLTFGKGGVLFGTAPAGGTMGAGVVFEITPPRNGRGWAGHTIWNFTAGNDGGLPAGSVIVDRSGNVYGTASFDGVGGYGTVYQLTPPAKGESTWTETTLWSFSNDGDGANPYGLAADKSGTLYGAAGAGGSHGDGVVYTLTGTGFVP